MSERAIGAIEAYLDQLQARLWLPPREVRRVIAEADDHLNEATVRYEADGLAREDAERHAVSDFGTPREVAARFAAERGRAGVPSLFLELFLSAALLCSIGFIAIGASGLVAEGMAHAFGGDYIAGDAPGITYTPDRCAQLTQGLPAGTSCASAALQDHWGEVVDYRVAVGVLGLFGLGVALLMRRAYRDRTGARVLPVAFESGIGMAAFGGGAGLLIATGGMETAFRVPGAGALLSGGLVSLVAMVIYLRAFVRALRVA